MNESRVLETFLDLVRIDSPSKEEAGVANYCKKALEEAGCSVVIDGSAAASGSNTGNCIATLVGTGASPAKVFLTAHMDNVNPCRGVVPHVRDGVVYSDGTTVLGGDDKAGIAAIIETMRTLAEEGGERPTVVVLFTTQEEIGMHGAKNLSNGLFDGELALVCDGDLAPGTAIIGAPYHYSFIARFTGKAAHAGVAPEKGISAICMAAHAVASMELGRLAPHASANIGTISGGNANNIVAQECTLTGECRSLDAAQLEGIRAQMEAAMTMAASKLGGSVEQEWKLEYPGFSYSDDDPLVKVVLDAAVAAGLEPRTDVSGGGTDANIFFQQGARPIALGTGMTGFHTTSECLAVRDLCDTARHLIAICRLLAQ